MGFILFKTMDAILGIRVPPEEELAGLDVKEHGTAAYPNFPYVEEISA
jgi:Amt family ammonium transporter